MLPRPPIRGAVRGLLAIATIVLAAAAAAAPACAVAT